MNEVEAQMLAGLAEVKEMCRSIIWRVDLTNGRVSKLEEKEEARALGEAQEAGARVASADVVLTRAQLSKLAGLVSAMAALAGGIGAVLTRLLG